MLSELPNYIKSDPNFYFLFTLGLKSWLQTITCYLLGIYFVDQTYLEKNIN